MARNHFNVREGSREPPKAKLAKADTRRAAAKDRTAIKFYDRRHPGASCLISAGTVHSGVLPGQSAAGCVRLRRALSAGQYPVQYRGLPTPAVGTGRGLCGAPGFARPRESKRV